MISLSIVIINFKTASLIEQCIRSIMRYENALDYEIIIVDNNSKDELNEVLALFTMLNVTLVQMGYNSGFSRANNAAMRIAEGEFVLLLNSDTYLIKENTLKNTLDFLKTKSSKDVVASVLINENYSYQCSVRTWYFGLTDLLYANSFFVYFTRDKKNYRADRNIMDKKLHDKTGQVLWVNGAFQMFHSSLIKESKLFYDEDFFLYGEDVEWSYRINKNGGKFFLLAEEKIVHIGSASSGIFNKLKIAQIELSNWLFMKKSFGSLYFIGYLLFDYFNMYLDGFLYKLNMSSSRQSIESLAIRKVKKYLYKKYFLKILFAIKENSNSLKFNVYENDKEYIQK